MKRCFQCFHEYSDEELVCPYCGRKESAASKEPIYLAPGTVLADRYLLGDVIGSGGFGIVYKAFDMKLESTVAVKEFFVSRLVTRAPGLKNLIITKKSQQEFDYRKERFLAEARNMAKFGGHRAIPNVFEFFEENNTAYIVMELLIGQPLNKYLIEHGGKLDVDFAIMIANEVGSALGSLHDQNIIHKDVAPDNIFICSGKEIKVKLMDFGAAKLADSTDNTVDIILKPGYSPPEQYDKSSNIGPWTDIYALGATLYMILTGIKPEESTDRKISDTLSQPNQLNPMIPENLNNTIMKAMAIDCHLRFKNISEFIKALNGEKKIVKLEREIKRKRFRRIGSISLAFLSIISIAAVVVGIFRNLAADDFLAPATISVWVSVEDGSTEADAVKAVIEDFMGKFPDVAIDLNAISSDIYESELQRAFDDGVMPTLFESTNIYGDIMNEAYSIDNILSSDQAKECLFIDQYSEYYDDSKKLPLAIEVPVAYVITSGTEFIQYDDTYFGSLADFGLGTDISMDSRYSDLIYANFSGQNFSPIEEFMNNNGNTSPVLLSSSMILNEVRTTMTNYEKSYVFYNSDSIKCRFTYEWSIGGGDNDEIAAAEMLLSWMLGNVYQNMLMISECNDGQIPVNKICFESKVSSQYLSPLENIYNKFAFIKDKT